jgi:hypothetical protein
MRPKQIKVQKRPCHLKTASSYKMGYRGIEPDGGKLSNPVPRREKDSNHPEYPQVRLSFSPDILIHFAV